MSAAAVPAPVPSSWRPRACGERPIPAGGRGTRASGRAPRPTAAVVQRRRRAAVVVVVAALVALAVAAGAVGAWLAGPPGGAAGEPVPMDAPATVVVRSGDTLWDLVRPHVPAGADLGAHVAAVADANDLDDPRALRPGTAVRLASP